MNRPVITDFMGDGFTLNKAHNQYLENLELWNYVQALDKYADDLEDKLSERQTPEKANDTDKSEVLTFTAMCSRWILCCWFVGAVAYELMLTPVFFLCVL